MTPRSLDTGIAREPVPARGVTDREAGSGALSPGLQTVLGELFGPPDRLEKWSRRTRRAMVRGDFAETVTLCSTELRAHPTAALALFLRGAAELELGHYGRAISDFTRAISFDLRFACLTESLAGR